MQRTRLVLLGLILALVLACAGVALALGVMFMRLYPSPFPNTALAQLFPSSASTPSAPAQISGPNVGAPAIDFSLPGLDQGNVALAQFRGKPVIINFWATWCGPCSAEMPAIEKVSQQRQGDVAFVAVNQGETQDEVRGYVDLYHLHFPMLLDQHFQVGDQYRVRALPTTVFIDKTGTIREVHIGGPMSPDFIEGRIRTLFGL